MPVNLSLNSNLSLVLLESSGEVVMKDIMQAEKQIHESSVFQRYSKRLDVYHTDVVMKCSLDDFFHYKSILGKLTGYLSNMRVAVVTESSFIFGIHRMYDVENKIISVYADHKTFYTLEKACDWLAIPSDILQERFQH